MKKRLYNNYISAPNTIRLSWLNFAERRRNEDFEEYQYNQLQKSSCCNCKRDNKSEPCNNLSEKIQGVSDSICFKELLAHSHSNVYAYFTSSMLYPEILERSKLIIFDYELECENKSIFYEDSDIYITEQGDYKITYGVICSNSINGKMYLLLNNKKFFKQSQLQKVSLTKFTTHLSLKSGDVLSLIVEGEYIKLYHGGINGFILIEKCC